MKHTKRGLTLLVLAAAIVLGLFYVPQRASAVDQEYDVTITETTTALYYFWATLDSDAKKITLTDDVDFDGNTFIFESGSWTLDLNGKTIYGTPPIAVRKGASLVITGSGTIRGDSFFSGVYIYGEAINVANGATLTIRGGDISIASSQYSSDSNNADAIDSRGTLNFESGNISLKSLNSFAIYSSGGTVNITGANLTMTSGDTCIYATGSSTVNMTGGKLTMNGTKTGMSLYSSELTVSGGYIDDNSAQTFRSGTVTITGGALDVVTMPTSTYSHTGGVVCNKTTGEVTASVLDQDYTIPANATLTVAEGQTLTLNEGAVLTVAEGGTLTNNGSIYFSDGAKIVNNGSITDNGQLYVDGALHQHALTAQYTDLGDGTHRIDSLCTVCPIGYVETVTQAHTYQYTADAGILESCQYCDLENALSVEYVESVVYDGLAHEAVISGQPVNPQLTLALEHKNDQGEQASPVAAGAYTVTLAAVQGEQELCRTREATITIQPKELYVYGVNVYDKTYDGTPDMQIGQILLTGVATGDDVEVTCTLAKAPAADADRYSLVYLEGLALTGADAANYRIEQQTAASSINYYDEPEMFSIDPVWVYISALEQTVALGSQPDQTKWEQSGLLEGHRVAQLTLVGDTTKATDFGTVTPEAAVILDENGNDMTHNYNLTYESATLQVLCPDHDSFDNGFCLTCHGYQAAAWNEE